MVSYVKELLLTQDPVLFKMGSFFERYFMEHILFNLSQFVPDGIDVPLPLYMLERWASGGFFKMVQDCLTKTPRHPDINLNAVVNLLEPFGFNQEETFPLPPSIKKLAWPSIHAFLQEDLPQLVAKAIPVLPFLSQQKQNADNLNHWLQDDSLSRAVHYLSDNIVEQSIQKLADANISLGQKLNALLPSHSLSDTQQKGLDGQWGALLEENNILNFFKDFGKEFLEGLVLQLFNDLFKNYQEVCTSEGLQDLFDGDDDEKEEQVGTFVAWLMQGVTQACEPLSVEGMNDEELETLKNAIALKNVIQDAKDPTLVLAESTALEKLWPALEPKFEHLSQHLLNIFGYDRPRNLPVSEELRPMLWKMITSALPKILFEQASDLILPILEKTRLQNQIKDLPQGELMIKGCKFFAKDLIDHLPQWMDQNIVPVLDKLQTENPLMGLSDKGKIATTKALKDFSDRGEEAFQPFWQWIESYIEGLALKIADGISQKSEADLIKIKMLAQETREKLLALETRETGEDVLALEIKSEEILIEEEEPLQQDGKTPAQEEKDILVTFTDQLFEYLGIKTEKDLFGIPSFIGSPLLIEIKKKFAQGLLGIYRLDKQVRHSVISVNPVEVELPTSVIAQAALSLTRYALDKATDTLTNRVDGQMEGVVRLYSPLKIWLNGKAQEGYQTAGLFQEIIDQQILTPFLEGLFHLLDAQDVQPYKQHLADWINPLLTEQVIKTLSPLLEKEREGQADFDQALLIALLPALTHHLKHLNEASLQDGGLNSTNFAKATGEELHPAIMIEGDPEGRDLQRQEFFYQDQVDLIFQLIFPNGHKDLKVLIPEIDLTPEQLELLWTGAKSGIATQLPEALDSLFDRELLIEMFNAFFETIIENLDQPIIIKSKEVKPLTEEEKANQSQMDHLVGELVIEGARFIDLPVDRIAQLPSWAKRLIGVNGIEQNTSEAIGAAIREQFNGELLSKTLKDVLSKLAEKKHVKMTEEEKIQGKKNAYAHFNQLERKIAEKGLAYVFRLIGARIQYATDIFRNPIYNGIREAVLAVCSFIMVRLVAGTLRLFKIERFVVNRLHEIIQHGCEKTLDVFSQPDLHEDLVFKGVEAFENALTDQPEVIA